MKSFYFVILSVAISNAYAGVYIESETHDKTPNNPVSRQRMYIQDGMARIEADVGDAVTIFKGDTLYVLDAGRKTYMAIDAAALESTMGALNDMMKLLQAQLVNMPPDQRAMMEKALKQSGMPGAGAAAKPVVFDAIATKATEKAAGRICKIWNITSDGTPSAQVCVVPYTGLPGKDDIQALASKMNVLLNKLPEALRGQYSGNPLQQASEISAKLNGVPFITRSYSNGALEAKELVVQTWQQQAIAASQFEIPAGYVKQELPIGQHKQ